MLNITLKDVAKAADPWVVLASSSLLMRNHQDLLRRLGYISLLLYAAIYILKDYSPYIKIFNELL